MVDWYLVLMIWGNAYGDADCNRLIRAAHAHSATLKGVVVLTDQTDRALDPRAAQIPIAPDFDTPENRANGLAVKISMFDIAALPRGAACVYVDLDSAIIGDAGRIAALTQTAPLWTLPTPRARFSALARLRWRISRGRRYGAGNSSVLAFRNGFAGNPAAHFRSAAQVFGRAAPPGVRSSDDCYIGWACQGIIRPLPADMAVRFRIEFLEITLWLNRIKAQIRRRTRQDLVIVTFDGALTKPQTIAALPDGAVITDHHGRRGLWNDVHMGGLRAQLLAALRG